LFITSKASHWQALENLSFALRVPIDFPTSGNGTGTVTGSVKIGDSQGGLKHFLDLRNNLQLQYRPRAYQRKPILIFERTPQVPYIELTVFNV